MFSTEALHKMHLIRFDCEARDSWAEVENGSFHRESLTLCSNNTGKCQSLLGTLRLCAFLAHRCVQSVGGQQKNTAVPEEK